MWQVGDGEGPELKEIAVRLTLVVKAYSEEEAKDFVEQKLLRKLNEWIGDTSIPAPEGALLLYTISATTLRGVANTSTIE